MNKRGRVKNTTEALNAVIGGFNEEIKELKEFLDKMNQEIEKIKEENSSIKEILNKRSNERTRNK